ncbi:ArnT family glycosyltransferase [Adhaeribacter radiodurans]|uniref:Glycosyltransferase family 39 protein n=1 Tax=Adhaeribacter radiodurans TaxID=2745197 RepID=A0A7L7L735_9BACT|nr:glycosyltransferase family 39 protein [Adhaeribacter radiodurans]QMU28593.1 glycosyltransferase family 39 protein [Adhaeribacter radiodurans]
MPQTLHQATTLIQRTSVQVLLLFVILYATFFQNLQAIEPSLMEARNFTTVREMTQNGNWLIPTLNGEARLAKPPLPTWLTAISVLISGDLYDLVTLRFPAALIASLAVYFLFLLCRQLTSDRLTPFLAALVLATSFSFFNIGRQGTWDIYCHSFMIGAIWLLVKGLQTNGKAYGYFVGAGILLGCSFLSKGPVSFFALLLPFLLSYWYGYGRAGFKKHWFGILLALFICLVLSLAWPLYIYLHEPAKLATNISNESTAWVNRHVKPFWFYLSFPWQAGVWAVFAVAALIIPYARRRIAPFGNYRFLSSWVFICLFLLSLIPEKKERYLLPLLIPLALITAHYIRFLLEAFQQKTTAKSDRFIYTFNSLLFTIISLGVPVLLYWFAFSKNIVSLSAFAVSSIFFIGLGICFLLALKKKNFGLFLGGTVGVHILSLFTLLPNYQNMFYPVKNYVGLDKVREQRNLDALPFYALHNISPEHIWELGKKVDTITVVNQKLELPASLPIALFSRDSLSTAMLPEANLSLEKLAQYQYDRRHPERVYHLYLISK